MRVLLTEPARRSDGIALRIPKPVLPLCSLHAAAGHVSPKVSIPAVSLPRPALAWPPPLWEGPVRPRTSPSCHCIPWWFVVKSSLQATSPLCSAPWIPGASFGLVPSQEGPNTPHTLEGPGPAGSRGSTADYRTTIPRLLLQISGHQGFQTNKPEKGAASPSEPQGWGGLCSWRVFFKPVSNRHPV